jgi:predicted CXXCH cytochrome family protein
MRTATSAVLAAAAGAMRSTGDVKRPIALAVLVLIASAWVACGSAQRSAIDAARAAAARADPDHVSSNTERRDYAGSRACAPCHGEIYARWSESPMHRMTRLPENIRTRTPFNGEIFRFKDDSAKLSRRSGHLLAAISSPVFGDHVYRVTRIIGGRYREDFAGVQVAPNDPSLAAAGEERILPFTYVFSPPSFRSKGYSVMSLERPGLKEGTVWRRACIFCHNTAPYLSTVLGALHGAGAPIYQGEIVDSTLPADRRASPAITDPPGLLTVVSDELRVLGARTADDVAAGPVGRGLERAVRATWAKFDASHLIEVGIGCEACHGGSHEHVQNAGRKPTFAVKNAFWRFNASSHEEAAHASERVRTINRTCARCHQVLFTHYLFTWEGGERYRDPGGSHISSGEARDFLLGGCSTAMSCVTCHDPHALDAPEKLRVLETTAGNRICVSCHAHYGSADALRRHAHHEPDGQGAVCINCHMPKKNMGLAYNLSRYHRIGSPTDKARVEGDRPLECALCHVDESVEELVSAMERFWGKRYDRTRLAALYGDLGVPALVATVISGHAHEQATAMHVLGEHRVQAALAPVAEQMLNPYPLVRYYARQALGQIAGRPCDVSLDQDDVRIKADTARWLAEISHPN